jgi:hypothetical protein
MKCWKLDLDKMKNKFQNILNYFFPKKKDVVEVSKKIVHSQATCLECGEVLVSEHRHDYKTCSCPNETMIDGGNDYVRYGGKDLSKVEIFTVFDNDDFKFVRRYASRGGRGVNGDEPLTWTKLCDMNDGWLEAVLKYYPAGTDNPHLRLIRKEIQYRKDTKVWGSRLQG